MLPLPLPWFPRLFLSEAVSALAVVFAVAVVAVDAAAVFTGALWFVVVPIPGTVVVLSTMGAIAAAVAAAAASMEGETEAVLVAVVVVVVVVAAAAEDTPLLVPVLLLRLPAAAAAIASLLDSLFKACELFWFVLESIFAINSRCRCIAGWLSLPNLNFEGIS